MSATKTELMQLSSLLQRFNEPETLKMAKLGRELRAKGFDITDLSLGEPDFDTPDHIKLAAKKAIDDNYSHYTPVAGYLDLRQAICEKLKRDNGLDYTPEQIVVSTGAKQSIANTVLSIVDAGDEVIIPTPYWVTYSEIVKMGGGEVKFVNTSIKNGYKITPQELEEAITARTRLFMFSSPCNPSGAVYSKKELTALAEVFKKHPDVFIMSDEIYEYINFEAAPDSANAAIGRHESFAQFDFLKGRVIVINGLSKGYAMTGWRLGYIAAHASVAKACEKIQGQVTSGANAVTQRAAIAALTGDMKPTAMMVTEFTKRRKRVMELLKEIPFIECSEPQGAFYVFPKVSHYFGKKDGDELIENADDLCMYLLNKAHVSAVTGKAFGEPNCIRISFANSMENIEKGFAKIKAALAKLS
ncbi:MAG TPA: pyridoxal phosphate-dependent aminotransferase [Ferruginibacter sp.]|nr:pyridoxal phosphate-dependent aminotransferase [Ferruginibacter sp.]